MLIGAPKEINNNGFRVGMTLASVREVAMRGHLVPADGGASRPTTDADPVGVAHCPLAAVPGVSPVSAEHLLDGS